MTKYIECFSYVVSKVCTYIDEFELNLNLNKITGQTVPVLICPGATYSPKNTITTLIIN